MLDENVVFFFSKKADFLGDTKYFFSISVCGKFSFLS